LTDNSYAPPRASLDSPQTPAGPSPALWNPEAAAFWSLLFPPIFGALLHMTNWRALGEPALAASARRWVIASVVFYLIFLLVPFILPQSDGQLPDLALNAGAFVLLIAWYLASARGQAKYVKGRFGTGYRRRGWGKPLLRVVLAFGALLGAAFIVDLIAALATGSWFRVVPASGP